MFTVAGRCWTTSLTGKASSYLSWRVLLAGGHNQMRVRRAMQGRAKTQTQVTLRYERYVSLHPQVEEFTLLTEQMDIVEVLR